jgi:hypothetical protein
MTFYLFGSIHKKKKKSIDIVELPVIVNSYQNKKKIK